MKTLITVLCITVSVYTQAQKISADKIPLAVSGNFQKQFPQAEKTQWEIDEKDYEVNFHLNKVEYSAKYNSTGAWLETEQEIKITELPENIQQTIKKEFGKAEKKNLVKLK